MTSDNILKFFRILEKEPVTGNINGAEFPMMF